MDTWPITLTAVASNGNVTQLYPAWCSAGAGGGTQGEAVRRPVDGMVAELHVLGDGTNAGTLELWDVSGVDLGADVDTATTISNAQITAGVSAGTARKILDIDIAGTDKIITNLKNTTIMKGLAARFSNAGPTGSCNLNIQSSGIYQKYDNVG